MTTTIKQLPFQPMNDIHNEEIKVLETLLIAIKDKKDIEKNFALFLDDVKNHFEFEENLMKKYRFFAIVPHTMEHNRILGELTDIQNSKLDDYQFLDKYFNEMFIPWLDNHINTIDTVTSGYFNMIGAEI